MTVQVMQAGTAAGKEEVRSAEKPYMYTPVTDMYTERAKRYRRTERKAGAAVIPVVQLLISAGLGAALWAGANIVGGETGALCERLAELFR